MSKDSFTFKPHEGSKNISPFSRAGVQVNPIRIDERGDMQKASSASGFLWNENGKLFLFTNYHVVSGVNAITGKHLSDWFPNACDISFFAEAAQPTEQNPDQHILCRCTGRIEYDGSFIEDMWRLHSLGKSVDLVACEIAWENTDYTPVCLNLTAQIGLFDGEVGEDVFVVGYPEGQNFELGLPLWKRGSIATDPELDQNDLPQYYIDTIGNPGLSGSFVILKKELSRIGDVEGRVRNKYVFSGVYAGRLGSAGLESQIGRVFKVDAVKDIVNSFDFGALPA